MTFVIIQSFPIILLFTIHYVLLMTRSLKKGFYVNERLLQKVAKMTAAGEKKVVKVWDRACQIVPEMI